MLEREKKRREKEKKRREKVKVNLFTENEKRRQLELRNCVS